jgi:hydroxymethylglutaryl-CoA synthase
MVFSDHLYDKGKFYSGTVVHTPTNHYRYLKEYVSCIAKFEDGLKVPGRITDHVPDRGFKLYDQIDAELIPRFRRNYSDGEEGLIHYSSLNFSFLDDYYPYQEYIQLKPSKEKGRPGIVGYGAYIPKYRIKNGEEGVLEVRERSLPYADEDTTTFAVEAGKRALIHSALDSSYVKKCFVGSESPPYAVKPVMATVTQALELGEKHMDGFYMGGIDSQFACKAATDLFIDAAALVNFPVFNGEYVMVIGSDNSQAAPGDPLDYTVGAGAAAFLFGRRDVIATLDHYISYTSDTPDFYRREGQRYPRHGGRFTGKPAYYKHVLSSIEGVLDKSGLTPKEIDYIICHSPNGVFPQRVAYQAGFSKEQIEPSLVVKKIGNLYSGSSPMGLAAVLDIAEPGDKILMAAYGSGAGSDAYIFTATGNITKKRGRQVKIMDQIENPHREYVSYEFYRRMKDTI